MTRKAIQPQRRRPACNHHSSTCDAATCGIGRARVVVMTRTRHRLPTGPPLRVWSLRMPPELHREAQAQAQAAGVSTNRLLVSLIARGLGMPDQPLPDHDNENGRPR